jgi:hypothetical protein
MAVIGERTVEEYYRSQGADGTGKYKTFPHEQTLLARQSESNILCNGAFYYPSQFAEPEGSAEGAGKVTHGRENPSY